MPVGRRPKPAADTTSKQAITDTLSVGEEGDVETTVVYSAKDSIRFHLPSRTLYLFGEAKIEYGDINLEAGLVNISLRTNTLEAYSTFDSLGQRLEVPVFKDKSESFQADTIVYNFKTNKGLVRGVVTEQEGGLVRSELTKKMPDGTLYNARARYTTCDLEHPHFAIRASKLKMKPNKYVVSGPFNLEINEIPTPIGFPFGVFPMPEKRTSGLIVPAYGESTDRGYFLRDGGYYWAINDYMDLSLMGQIYSLGGWGATADFQYKKRYAFSGGLNISYNRIVRENSNFEEGITNDFWVRWNHSPVSRGTSRFSASVNAGTSTYNANNSFSVDNYISPAFNSNISYSKNFTGTPFSMSANVRHNQNVQTGEVNIFPELGVNMTRVYPFKGMVKNQKSPLAQLNFSYTFKSKFELSNTGLGRNFSFESIQENEIQSDSVYKFNLDNAEFLLGEARYGAKHSIPVSTTLTLFKYFQVTPSLQYEEIWYPERLNYEWDPDEERVRVNEEQGFFRANTFNLNAGANTTFYMFYYFKGDRIRAIRQLITPSVSLGYQPDFTDPRYGYYQEVQTRADGTVQSLSRFDGSIYGSPRGGKRENVNINLESQFEMKVKDEQDTVKGVKKIPILRVSTGYDVLADSFNLQDIRLTTNAKLFNDKLNVTVSGVIDPYAYLANYSEQTGELVSQRRTPNLAIQAGQGIGTLSRMNLSLSTRLSPKGLKGGGNPMDKSRAAGQDPQQELLDDIKANPDRYIDFNIPWSLNLRYNLNYSQTGFREPNIAQTVTFSGDLSLTEKWKINVRSSYDFQQKEFGFTQIGIDRDLHCWQMNVSWTPFGRRQSYSIDIRVKSSLLQDLKVSKRNVWFDR